MENTPEQNNIAPITPAPVAPAVFATKPKNFREAKRKSRGGDRPDRPKPEFDHKIINIRRVTRVASGGRRFSFSVAVVAGNRKGSVGVGIGKAGDTSLAIDKATRDAKKHMLKVNLTPSMSIAHPIFAKYCSAEVTMMPAKGRGLIAGSSVRNVLEFAGIKDVNAKLLSGSKNKLNNARAAIEALKGLTLKK
ncbi:MAG: 30S ribosomal protein S5 [Candidatus Taylorbacteria bacterium]|nr:30S ribosomal protein S5 [Candidatus Taylorbacteria bacterium]